MKGLAAAPPRFDFFVRFRQKAKRAWWTGRMLIPHRYSFQACRLAARHGALGGSGGGVDVAPATASGGCTFRTAEPAIDRRSRLNAVSAGDGRSLNAT